MTIDKKLENETPRCRIVLVSTYKTEQFGNCAG